MSEVSGTATGRWAQLAESRMLPLALSAIWALASLAYAMGYLMTEDRPTLGFGQVVLAIFAFALPLLLIWGSHALIGAVAAERRKADRLEEGMEILYAEMQAIKAALAERPEAAPVIAAAAPREPVEVPGLARLSEQIDELNRMFAELPAPPAAEPVPSAAPRGGKKQKPVEDAQPLLPMGEPGDGDGLTRHELIAALNFPQDAKDQAGFAILKKARATREVAQVLQAAEDILTLLAQRGVYMDDLAYGSVPVKDWRGFARGERQGKVAGMASILDERVVGIARETVRTDPVFRDTSLHFQRRFDATLVAFCERASDAELAAFANTRTARAFVLLSAVSGAIGGE